MNFIRYVKLDISADFLNKNLPDVFVILPFHCERVEHNSGVDKDFTFCSGIIESGFRFS
jgi:hypothetical protein